MHDVFTKAKRSDVMSRIRSRGNADTELVLMRLLRANKISGWRRHAKIQVTGGAWRVAGKTRKVTGDAWRVAGRNPEKSGAHGVTRPTFQVKPDFVFRQVRLALFVDGCFWHGCPKHGTKPKGNAAFWRKKFAGNIARDALVTRTLRKQGWQVLRIWEHELARKNQPRLLRRLQHHLESK